MENKTYTLTREDRETVRYELSEVLCDESFIKDIDLDNGDVVEIEGNIELEIDDEGCITIDTYRNATFTARVYHEYEELPLCKEDEIFIYEYLNEKQQYR